MKIVGGIILISIKLNISCLEPTKDVNSFPMLVMPKPKNSKNSVILKEKVVLMKAMQSEFVELILFQINVAIFMPTVMDTVPELLMGKLVKPTGTFMALIPNVLKLIIYLRKVILIVEMKTQPIVSALNVTEISLKLLLEINKWTVA